LKVIIQDIKKLETEALIVSFFADVRPLKGLAGELDWLLCGSLSDLLLHQKLEGSLGEVALFTSRGKIPAQKIFLVGLGSQAALSPSTLRKAARAAASTAWTAGVTRVALEYFPSPNVPQEAALQAVQKGLMEGAPVRKLDISLVMPDAATYEKISRLVKK